MSVKHQKTAIYRWNRIRNSLGFVPYLLAILVWLTFVTGSVLVAAHLSANSGNYEQPIQAGYGAKG